MNSFKILLIISLISINISLNASDLLIPMDDSQNDHLKAYGLVYWALDKGANASWFLGYRGGSFLIEGYEKIIDLAIARGITYTLLNDSELAEIRHIIENNNMSELKLEKAPKIAVYTPESTSPWDDAVTLALTYAHIPYDKLWDKEILAGKLSTYDWLHLHHEDFTGQYGKFYKNYRHHDWYKQQQIKFEKLAHDLGFKKVSKEKLAVVLKIKEFLGSGGFLFAMCSATDSFDIALAASDTDICDTPFDGDGVDPDYQKKLNYDYCLAFKDFKIITNPMIYEYSNIDLTEEKSIIKNVDNDYFTLFDFSAKFDPIPTILTQNHTRIIKGFMGQTTSFRRKCIKKSVVILGDVKNTNEVKYLHGSYGAGFFTFYGGHDPEDHKHYVKDPPTELYQYKNSPGYRLILNNILFPATNKKKKKT